MQRVMEEELVFQRIIEEELVFQRDMEEELVFRTATLGDWEAIEDISKVGGGE